LFSEFGRSRFHLAVVFLCIICSLMSSTAVAQRSFSSTADTTLPDAPQPERIPSSAADGPQQAAGSITGTVLDTNHNALKGARVMVVGQSTSAVRTAVAGDNGQFAFTALPPDLYQLTITASGMNTHALSQISLHGGETHPVSVTLSVFGGVTSVTVSGDKDEAAEQQVKIALQQRIVGIVPNFYSSYDWNAPSLGAKQKLDLSFRSIIDPFSFVTTAGVAGVQQYRNTHAAYGGGLEGYGQRYGAAWANHATSTLLSRGVYPAIFHQDPRYFYKGNGTIRSRMLYATSASVVARGDDGRWEPNYSHVLGTFSAAGIATLYYPDSDRGASRVLFSGLAGMGTSAVSNLLREFVFKRLTTHVPKDQNGKPLE